MALDSNAQIQIVTTALRRKYFNDLVGLKKLWDRVFSEATEFVEITGTAFEGGSSTGSLIFERLAYLAAVEAVLSELDPTGTPPIPGNGTYVDYRRNFLQT